jgi:hypothetical protein
MSLNIVSIKQPLLDFGLADYLQTAVLPFNAAQACRLTLLGLSSTPKSKI